MAKKAAAIAGFAPSIGAHSAANLAQSEQTGGTADSADAVRRMLAEVSSDRFAAPDLAIFNNQKTSKNPRLRRVEHGRERRLTRALLKRMKLIGNGQICDKFILGHVDDLIIVVDQHAADERIWLERMEAEVLSTYAKEQIERKSLHPMPRIVVTSAQMRFVEDHAAAFEKWGVRLKRTPKLFFTKETGADEPHNIAVGTEHELSLFTVPEFYGTALSLEDVKEIIRDRGPFAGSETRVRIPCIARLLHSKACRTAIKFGDTLTRDECLSMIERLNKCMFPFQCAHGRPSMIPLVSVPKTTTACSTGGALSQDSVGRLMCSQQHSSNDVSKIEKRGSSAEPEKVYAVSQKRLAFVRSKMVKSGFSRDK